MFKSMQMNFARKLISLKRSRNPIIAITYDFHETQITSLGIVEVNNIKTTVFISIVGITILDWFNNINK